MQFKKSFLKHVSKEQLIMFFAFSMVGTLGVAINGLVYVTLAFFSFFTWAPLGGPLNLAWGTGILVATVSNFILDSYIVFGIVKRRLKK